MVAEYVAAVRAVLTGDPAGFSGELFRTGMVPLDSPPVRPALPIYLAALGPRMLELAGRIADGVILNLMSPAQAGQAAGLVRAAAVAAGRDASAVEIACVVHTCVSDDAAAAAMAAREVVPRYILHPAVGRLFAEHDAAADLAAARERTLAGDRPGAALHVPQHVADAFVAARHGRPLPEHAGGVPGGGHRPAGRVPDAGGWRLGLRASDRGAGRAGSAPE